MTKTIMMFLAFLLVLPILPWLPLSISLKGKLIIAFESFAIAAAAVLLAPLLPIWQIALLVLLICAVTGYFTVKYGLPVWSQEYSYDEEEDFEKEAAAISFPKNRFSFLSSRPRRKAKNVHSDEDEKPKNKPNFSVSVKQTQPKETSADSQDLSTREKISFEKEEELAGLPFTQENSFKEKQELEQKQMNSLIAPENLQKKELADLAFEQSEIPGAHSEKPKDDLHFEAPFDDEDIIPSLPEEKTQDKTSEFDDDYELELLFSDEGDISAESSKQTNAPQEKTEERAEATGLSLYSAEEDTGENLISTVLKEDELAELMPEKTASAEESEQEIQADFEELAEIELKELASDDKLDEETKEAKQNKEFDDLEDLDLDWMISEEKRTEKESAENVEELLDLSVNDSDKETAEEESLPEFEVDLEELADFEAATIADEEAEELEAELEELSEAEAGSSEQEKTEESLPELELDLEELVDAEAATIADDEEAEELEAELEELSNAETVSSEQEETEESLPELELDLEELLEAEAATIADEEAAEELEAELEELSEAEAVSSEQEETEEKGLPEFEVDLEELLEAEAATIADDEEAEELEVELEELSEAEAGSSEQEKTEEEGLPEFEVDLEELLDAEAATIADEAEAEMEAELEELSDAKLTEAVADEEKSLQEALKKNKNELNDKEVLEFDLDQMLFEKESVQETKAEELNTINLKDAYSDEENKEEAEKEIQAAFEELEQIDLEKLAFEEESFEELSVSEVVDANFSEKTKGDMEAFAEKSLDEEDTQQAKDKTFVELNEEEKSFFYAVKQELDEEMGLNSLSEAAALQKAEVVKDEASIDKNQHGEQADVPAKAEPEIQLESEPAAKEQARLSSEWLSLITKEITVKQGMLPFEEAEQTILRYLNAPLHKRDYYVIARMLLVFYVSQGKQQKAKHLVNELMEQFNEYPLLMEELKIAQSMLQN